MLTKHLFKILSIVSLSSCGLLHQAPAFEMEELSRDVLGSKTGEGISIQILPIPAQPKK